MLTSVEFVKPNDLNLKIIADGMREADRKEVWLSGGYTPKEALRLSVQCSRFTSVAVINGQPCAALGVMQGDMLSGTGAPWLLGTDVLLSHPRIMLRYGRQGVQDMLEVCPYLVNYVHVDNAASIRWLKALGFTLDEPVPYGNSQALFHPFYQEKRHV